MRSRLARLLDRVSHAPEAGSSLAEVLVTALLMGIVGTLIAAAFLDSHKVIRNADDEGRGLADIRIVSERLARDIRDARGVDPSTASATQLTLWIDHNSDYIQQDSETITWRVAPNGVGHFKVLREVLNGPTQVQATSLIVNLSFKYDNNATVATTNTTVVKVEMQYDVYLSYGTGSRRINFEARLRNVE